MTNSIIGSQSELPRCIPLFRYAPNRATSPLRDLDPRSVRSPKDLPPYLILGELDADSFEISPVGWSARWQGIEHDTHFDVVYKATGDCYVISQTWRGLHGSSSYSSARVPLDKSIAQTLYMRFPINWDQAAKAQLEAEYQLTLVEQPEDLATFCFIPDGAFRTIAFPIAVRNLRPVRQWLQESIARSPLAYPVSVEAKLIFQAINYIEGKAPEWTTQAAVAFNQSVIETGLAPHGFPVREVANDGSAAWTLRRDIYYVFIGLPFAGLTDFLKRMASENGSIRTTSAPSQRFELRPVVIPVGFEVQTESMTLWDDPRTTRSFLKFASKDSLSNSTVQAAFDNEQNSAGFLNQAETTSRDVVQSIEQIFQKTTQAAEQGEADAQYNLGLMYDTGEGVTRDLKQAVVWYTKAAEQGHASAQVNLGGGVFQGRRRDTRPQASLFLVGQSCRAGPCRCAVQIGSDVLQRRRRDTRPQASLFLVGQSCRAGR